MNRFLLIFLSILTLQVKSFTEDSFIEALDTNYDYYQVVYQKETSAVKMVAVIGIVNNQWSYSLFFEQLSNHNFSLKTTINNTSKTLETNTNYGMFFNISTKASARINVAIIERKGGERHDNFEIKIPSQTDEFKNDTKTIKGQALNNFPSSSSGSLTIKKIFLYVVIGLGIVSLGFLMIIIYVFKKQKGLLNPINEKTIIDVQPDEFQTFAYQEEESEKSKEETMEDLFKDYKSGKITESQLNSALRSLWWEDND